MAVERLSEMDGVNTVLYGDVALQVRQIVVFQEAEDAAVVFRPGLLPVDACVQVGYQGQHVERFGAGRRNTFVGDGRHMQVERKIVRQGFSPEDIL